MFSSAWLVSRILSVSLCWPAQRTKWLWLRTRGNPTRFAWSVILQPPFPLAFLLHHSICLTAPGFLIVWCKRAVWVWNEVRLKRISSLHPVVPFVYSAMLWPLSQHGDGIWRHCCMAPLQGQKYISPFMAEFRGWSDWKMQFPIWRHGRAMPYTDC